HRYELGDGLGVPARERLQPLPRDGGPAGAEERRIGPLADDRGLVERGRHRGRGRGNGLGRRAFGGGGDRRRGRGGLRGGGAGGQAKDKADGQRATHGATGVKVVTHVGAPPSPAVQVTVRTPEDAAVASQVRGAPPSAPPPPDPVTSQPPAD